MGSGIRTVLLIFVLHIYKFGAIRASPSVGQPQAGRAAAAAVPQAGAVLPGAETRCLECSTVWSPYCDDPFYPGSPLLYDPHLCFNRVNKNYASRVITHFMTFMLDESEELQGSQDLSSGIFRRRRSTSVWLERISLAFGLNERSKREIHKSLHGNLSRNEEKRQELELLPNFDSEAASPDEAESSGGGEDINTDQFQCYKLAFLNNINQLEVFRGCVKVTQFDVCELLINYNDRSRERTVFCEVCISADPVPGAMPCNDAQRLLVRPEPILRCALLSLIFVCVYTIS